MVTGEVSLSQEAEEWVEEREENEMFKVRVERHWHGAGAVPVLGARHEGWVPSAPQFCVHPPVPGPLWARDIYAVLDMFVIDTQTLETRT